MPNEVDAGMDWYSRLRAVVDEDESVSQLCEGFEQLMQRLDVFIVGRDDDAGQAGRDRLLMREVEMTTMFIPLGPGAYVISGID